MLLRTLVVVLAASSSLFTIACSGGEGDRDDADAIAEDALVRANMKDYGMANGVVATGPDARKLYEEIKANGGAVVGEHVVLAGLTGAEAGLTDPDDAKEKFGVSCMTKEGDPTFRLDMCQVYAIVKMADQERESGGRYQISLSGKLGRAVSRSLPLTSPPGIVGGSTTGTGRVTCRTIPGPVGSKCKMAAAALVVSFDEMMQDPENTLKAADARKIIKAFF